VHVVHVVYVFWIDQTYLGSGALARNQASQSVVDASTGLAVLKARNLKRANTMKNHTPEQCESLVRRLNDGGCPVLRDHGYKISPVGLAIEQIPGISCNQVFDLAQGGTGFTIELVLRNELDRPIDIQGYQLKTPWGVPKLSLLPAPRKSSERYPHYSFPGPGNYYDGSYVINPFFARRKSRLIPGEPIEGLLVASSEDLIPPEFPNLARIIATLFVFDTRRNPFSAQFSLVVDRRELIARERREQGMASSQPTYAGHV
jgi:hypothetical protein